MQTQLHFFKNIGDPPVVERQKSGQSAGQPQSDGNGDPFEAFLAGVEGVPLTGDVADVAGEPTVEDDVDLKMTDAVSGLQVLGFGGGQGHTAEPTLDATPVLTVLTDDAELDPNHKPWGFAGDADSTRPTQGVGVGTDGGVGVITDAITPNATEGAHPEDAKIISGMVEAGQKNLNGSPLHEISIVKSHNTSAGAGKTLESPAEPAVSQDKNQTESSVDRGQARLISEKQIKAAVPPTSSAEQVAASGGDPNKQVSLPTPKRSLRSGSAVGARSLNALAASADAVPEGVGGIESEKQIKAAVPPTSSAEQVAASSGDPNKQVSLPTPKRSLRPGSAVGARSLNALAASADAVSEGVGGIEKTGDALLPGDVKAILQGQTAMSSHGHIQQQGLSNGESMISDNNQPIDLPSVSASGAEIKGVLTGSGSSEMSGQSRGELNGIFSQIVDQAAVSLKNGKSEMKLVLKPEFLGQIRMQVLTENHHVIVKIIAETQVVKNVIEQNLGQLKADLQANGLEVDSFDVLTSQDPNRDGRNPRHIGLTKSGSNTDNPPPEEADAQATGDRNPIVGTVGGGGRIDFFA